VLAARAVARELDERQALRRIGGLDDVDREVHGVQASVRPMRDAVICSPLRTPVGRYGGMFADVPVTRSTT
jgi:hypothetical protein